MQIGECRCRSEPTCQSVRNAIASKTLCHTIWSGNGASAERRFCAWWGVGADWRHLRFVMANAMGEWLVFTRAWTPPFGSPIIRNNLAVKEKAVKATSIQPQSGGYDVSPGRQPRVGPRKKLLSRRAAIRDSQGSAFVGDDNLELRDGFTRGEKTGFTSTSNSPAAS